jgi:hypothetical protein
VIDNLEGINHAYALNGINGDYAQSRIPEHAAAFIAVLRLAVERIERGESVPDVVQAMALADVVRAVSGRV